MKARKILFIIFLGLLLLPLLNQHLKFIDSGEIYGIARTPNTTFSWAKWWNGTYREEKERYINDSIGFRQDFVRITNQVDFSLFGKINAGWIKRTPDNYLYYDGYLRAQCGADYAGDGYPYEILEKLKFLQDTFQKQGKLLVVIYAPSKANYFSDNLPPLPECKTQGKTNLQNYIRIGDSLGINQIDLNSWYLTFRNKKTDHLIFSKQGIHWTLYGALFATDSIIRYTENKMHIRMPHPQWSEIEYSYTARRTDDDAGKMLNLLIPIKEKFSYPAIHYCDDTTLTKPKTIYIGDSFIWTLIFDGILNHANTNGQYWYYFKDVFLTNYDEGPVAQIKDYKWPDEVKKADCIYIMHTPPNVTSLGNGFIEQAYAYYHPQ